MALVTGYGPDVVWRDVMRAAVLVRDGLPWVASNADLSLPTPFGEAPGHGVMVDLLERFSGVRAVVAGKPQRPLLDETVRRVGGDRPLMVGDRLDTDIEGAHEAEVDSLLVLTGVTGLEDLVAARRGCGRRTCRGTWAACSSRTPRPERDGDAWAGRRLAGARSTDGRLDGDRRRRPGRLVARGGVGGLGAPRRDRRGRRRGRSGRAARGRGRAGR